MLGLINKQRLSSFGYYSRNPSKAWKDLKKNSHRNGLLDDHILGLDK